jgi:hypothetical protein
MTILLITIIAAILFFLLENFDRMRNQNNKKKVNIKDFFIYLKNILSVRKVKQTGYFYNQKSKVTLQPKKK